MKFGDVVRNVKVKVDPETSGLERYVAGEHMQTSDLHIRSWGIIGDGYLGPAFHRKFVKGQVLYGSRRTYLQKVAVAEFDGVCANTTFVLEPKDDRLLSALLPFIMQTEAFTQHSIKQSKGSTNPYVNWKDLAWYEFPLPSLDEQRRIAEILWAADEAAEQIRNCISAQSSLKKILMRDLFDFDDDIPTVPFGDVGAWLSGGTPSRSRKSFWEGEIPWASPKDMKADVLQDTQEHISEEGIVNGLKLVPEGSILLVVRGMILAHTFPIAMTGRPMAFNQDMKALVVCQEFNPKYIFYWLQRHSNKILRLVSESSHGTKRVPTELLFRLQVVSPSRDRQNEIVALLEQCDRALNHLQNQRERLLELKKNLVLTLLERGLNVER